MSQKPHQYMTAFRHPTVSVRLGEVQHALHQLHVILCLGESIKHAKQGLARQVFQHTKWGQGRRSLPSTSHKACSPKDGWPSVVLGNAPGIHGSSRDGRVCRSSQGNFGNGLHTDWGYKCSSSNGHFCEGLSREQAQDGLQRSPHRIEWNLVCSPVPGSMDEARLQDHPCIMLAMSLFSCSFRGTCQSSPAGGGEAPGSKHTAARSTQIIITCCQAQTHPPGNVTLLLFWLQEICMPCLRI
jgi:hypothetical protein